jgi:hypothetical protein
VLRIDAYRFFFYANENREPAHIHVQRERMLAKFWLHPLALASNSGFSARELRKLLGLVAVHQKTFVEAWNEFFDG